MVSYFRFIRFRVSSHPDCIDKWNWGQRFGRAAARLDDVLKAEANMENLDEMMDRAVAGVKKVVIK